MYESYGGADPRATDLPSLGRYELAERTFFRRVFGWMGGGLLLTALVAWYFGAPDRYVRIFGASRALPIVLLVVQLGLVFGIQAAIRRLSPTVAATLFVVYSALLGLSLSSIFLVYTSTSIVSAFVASGATFAAAAIYGAVTKKDLTSFGRLCFFGLIGFVVASIVNLFLRSPGFSYVLSLFGVLLFVGLTAYDLQKLKDWNRHAQEGTAEDQAVAIGGALTLYLDFINLFLLMLRFMGQRRE